MSLLKQKAATVREKRLQAISAYYGKAETLLQENYEGQFVQRVRTFSQDSQSDILYALSIITTIKDSAIVVHGAAGCAVARLFTNVIDENNAKWVVTNLNERDSIMGSDVKLREAIRQVYNLHIPKIIFIISTPIVAINNDDIESVVEEQKEELGIAIVPVYSDGFRSKIGTTGYDLVSHSIIKHILLSDKAKFIDYVNLISVSEKAADVKEVNSLLNKIGLKTNLFPRYASFENIMQVNAASYSVSINPDEANYPGIVLENTFQIPFVQTVIPIGIDNTARWIADIGIATGHEAEARSLVDSEKERLNTILLNKKGAINKLKVFISLSPAYAFGIADLLDELGIELAGLKLSYIDQQHLGILERIKTDKPDFAILVGDGQLFEEENILRKLEPELYIGDSGDFAVAIRNGIPVVNLENIAILGFNGVLNLADKIRKVLSNTSFTQLISKKETKSYTKEWLKKSPNWFIKQEVK